MANLVTVTKDSRLILKIGGIISGLILVIYIIVQGGTLIRDLFFPKPPPPPLQAFGKLPHIPFPDRQTSQNITYRINTIDGKLPTFPAKINVYRLVEQEASLLALENARTTLDSKDFVENQTKITDTLYRFRQARTGIVIEYDIATKNFSITSNYLTNPFLVSTTTLPDEQRIKSDVQGFLQTIKSNLENIDFEKTRVEYLELRNGVLVPAENLANARFARVTLSQKAVEDVQIVYGSENNSLLTFIVSYPDSRFQIVEGDFYNYVVDESQVSDYPIKTAQQALEDLEAGNAFIVNPQNLTNVDITNVELKYYLNRQSREYLLPVIVFTGINFTAYVEAIPSTSLTN